MQEPEQNMQELKYKLMTTGNETEPALASITWQFRKEVLAFSILSNSRWHQGRSSHPSRQRWHHRTKRGVKQQPIEKKNLNQYPSRNHIRHGPNKLELVKILLSKNLLSARKEEIRMENMLAGHTWIDLRTLGIQGEVDQGATCAGRGARWGTWLAGASTREEYQAVAEKIGSLLSIQRFCCRRRRCRELSGLTEQQREEWAASEREGIALAAGTCRS